jgi:hypothetical protein
MSFITTNPNPFIVNVPELQAVLTTVTGKQDNEVPYTEYVNTTTNGASFNSIGTYNSGNVVFTSDIYLSNAGIFINGTPVFTTTSVNSINGNLYLAVTINNQEVARFNSNGLGIFTQTPAASIHAVGSAILQSDTGALEFYNALGEPRASISYDESTNNLSFSSSNLNFNTGSISLRSDTAALNFYNAAGAPKSSLNYNDTFQRLTLVNTAGDLAFDAVGGGITIATDADLIFDGLSIISGTSSGASGNYLRIKLNGAFYKIALDND